MARSASRLSRYDLKGEGPRYRWIDIVSPVEEREVLVDEIIRLVRAKRYDFERKLPVAVMRLLEDIND